MKKLFLIGALSLLCTSIVGKPALAHDTHQSHKSYNHKSENHGNYKTRKQIRKQLYHKAHSSRHLNYKKHNMYKHKYHHARKHVKHAHQNHNQKKIDRLILELLLLSN